MNLASRLFQCASGLETVICVRFKLGESPESAASGLTNLSVQRHGRQCVSIGRTQKGKS